MSYQIATPFNPIVREFAWWPAAVLRDEPTPEVSAEVLAQHFDDLYHVFLNHFAQLTHHSLISAAEEQRLLHLLIELLEVKRDLEQASR